jgi:competence protein ComEC
LIVYNIPKQTAIDIMEGRTCYFSGDPQLVYDEFTRNFHLQPSRILHRTKREKSLPNEFVMGSRRIVIINASDTYITINPRPVLDVVVLSKNPRLYMKYLVNAFTIRQVVIDSSVPAWKAKLWKKDCKSLGIPCHDVSENGPFILDLAAG